MKTSGAAGPTILLVEDDLRDVELTMMALKERNLADRVTVVRDGKECLDFLYRRGTFSARPGGNPTVLLLDIKMPKISGLEVLKTVKGELHLKSIPVVMLTSSRETADVIECYQCGANAYVVKPLSFSEFKNAIALIGAFWTEVNESPPDTLNKDASISETQVNG